MIALYAAFTAAVRVIHRVHGHAANGRLHAAPPRSACLAEGFVFVIEVADLANGGHALNRELANFAGGQLHQRDIVFLAEQLRRAASRAHYLPAASRIQFQVVHHACREECA